MNSRRFSMIHSISMFQTSSASADETSLYQSSSTIKPPIFTSCHSISAKRNSKELLNTSTSMKGTRSSSVSVPSQSLQKIDEKTRRSSEGVSQNKRLSVSTQGTLEIPERKQLPERKMSVANISEQFSSFISLSSKMGVQAIIFL